MTCPVPLQTSQITLLSVFRLPFPPHSGQVLPSSDPVPLHAAQGILTENVSNPVPSQAGHSISLGPVINSPRQGTKFQLSKTDD